MAPGNKRSEEVSILLAAYSSRMEEISRRSTLAWASVSGYLAFSYAAFHEIMDSTDYRSGIWAVSVWPVAMLAYVFAYSQWRQIFRLNQEVHSIEVDVARGHSDIHPPLTRRAIDLRGIIGGIIDSSGLYWIVLLILPASLGVVAAYQMGVSLASAETLAVSLFAAIVTSCLLAYLRMPQA
jgi:hypothetical protein